MPTRYSNAPVISHRSLLDDNCNLLQSHCCWIVKFEWIAKLHIHDRTRNTKFLLFYFLLFLENTLRWINKKKKKRFLMLNKLILTSFLSTLTHFMPLVSFYIPWKLQKTRGFLMFSGGIEKDQWHEMG